MDTTFFIVNSSDPLKYFSNRPLKFSTVELINQEFFIVEFGNVFTIFLYIHICDFQSIDFFGGPALKLLFYDFVQIHFSLYSLCQSQQG